MKPGLSILFSTFDRLPLWRRTLWALAMRPPSCSFEVVVCDDGSTQDVLGELKAYSSVFPWKFVRWDREEFARRTGVSRFHNGPAATNNVALRHSSGDRVVLQGNEVIPWAKAYDSLLLESSGKERCLAFSTTLHVPQHVLDRLDEYGTNMDWKTVEYCRQWPLNSPWYHADVTNMLALCTRSLWEELGGYDERYVGGLGKEDSDFVRRCRALPGWTDEASMVRSSCISLHQEHGSRTPFWKQSPAVMSDEKWKEGENLSKKVWDEWDGSHHNRQPWPWGEIGVKEVLTNA